MKVIDLELNPETSNSIKEVMMEEVNKVGEIESKLSEDKSVLHIVVPQDTTDEQLVILGALIGAVEASERIMRQLNA